MLRKLAIGEITKRTLPGSQSLTPKFEHDFGSTPQSSHNDGDCVNANEYDEEIPAEKNYSKQMVHGTNMSNVESITYTGSIEELQDLDADQIKLFENYKFKDPSDVSNNLEIANYKQKIMNTVNSNTIILISGSTGCGKSTQVPQYILDDCMSRKKNCNIIVTQPRRIAAISVSKQVNKERGWKNGLLVGYQVGRKKDYDPSTGKILYCTVGILLQKVVKAKNLSEFTHIILDEVHERSLEMDFLLLVIKKLLNSNMQSTRLIMMSATANTKQLSEYFNQFYGAPHNIYVPPQEINISGKRNYKIHIHHLDGLYGLIPSASKMEFNVPRIDETGYETAVHLVKAFDRIEVGDVEKNRSVLIFLPGIFEIEELHRHLEAKMISENHKWSLIPLHSSITNEEQALVFENPPLNYRKIILSTNIAESSITVPDVAYVIDFCLMKQLKNDLKSNYSMLIMSWASKSNCEQRAGRVGRVSDGKVYRLVTHDMYQKFDKNDLPEMQRCSLSRIVLMSKILDMGTPEKLLSDALDRPSLSNIVLTIRTLKQVGALLPTQNGVISCKDGDITFLGKVMAQLPLEPPMSKLIYFGYIFNILNEAIIMACGLSIKSIFSQPFNKRLEAYTQKLTWANYSCSDPIAYIAPYQMWLERKPEFDRNRNLERAWAYKNYIQLSAMRELHDLIDDVTFRLRRSFGIIANSGQMKWAIPETKAMACKVILAGAFYPNYFIRGSSNMCSDEHEVLKTLNEHDPNRTVYLTGFPANQPKYLYKEAIENLFPADMTGKPTVYFSSSNKVYVEFPMSISNDLPHKNNQAKGNQVVPGNICFGVYVALKMAQLKMDFKINLMNPEDAKRKMNLLSQRIDQNISQQKVLPIYKCIIDEIEENVNNIEITISSFESVTRFWAQLFDISSKRKLVEVWTIVKESNFTSVNLKDLKIDKIYIVLHKNEKYRAKLISISGGPHTKCKFFLIDFGETAELFIKDIFDIGNEDANIKVTSIPALAFLCTIAKIRPAVHGQLEINWSDRANKIFKVDQHNQLYHGKIYSIVNGVVSFEDLKYINEREEYISIPEYLIKNKMANQSEESYTSKIDHKKRVKFIESTMDGLKIISKDVPVNIKSPTEAESYTQHNLKGPHSPLVMSVQGISQNNTVKLIKIEGPSVNSVLLDTDPNDYHEKLFVSGNVCLNENDRLTLWDSTMMPNIAGIPTIICLLFAPCVEIRCNPSYTKLTGAICGLGYDPITLRPLFQENDIEITFDTVVEHEFLNQINVIRMMLNKCVNPYDDEGPGDIFELQHNLQKSLLQLFSYPAKFKSPEPFLKRYSWGSIPKSRLQTPYQANSPINHPMAGSDVYKLLWGVNLSKKLSQMECKDLKYKLCKIQRLKERFNYYSISNEPTQEELSCPLCHQSFSNNASLILHFNNYQHIERYEHARNELHSNYTGPFTNIQHL